MITLITGAPGSGKTLYTIDKLMRPLVGTSVSGQDDDGNQVKYERVIYSNINGLLLDHQAVDAKWLEDLHNQKQPGMVVVFDEVQRVWPNRPAGSKKPPAVEFLETHRHEGIDLVIMTQNPQLLDPAVRALVGRHLHMRRIAALGAAVVYEWDACSNSLNFKAAFTKTGYRYSSSVFKLYKSAKVHTKPKRSLPAAVWIAAVAVCGAAYAWPTLMDRITARAANPAMLTKDAPGAIPAPTPAVPLPTQQTQPVAPIPAVPERPVGPMAAAAPVFAGCAVAKDFCQCYDTSGAVVDGDPAQCRRAAKPAPVTLALQDTPATGGRPSNDLAADLAMIEATSKRQRLPLIY